MRETATIGRDRCPKDMEHTSQQHTNGQPHVDSASDTGKLMNLRPYLRLRLGLFALALGLCLLWVGNMTFGNGAFKSLTTDPQTAQAAWQELVSETLESKRPVGEPLALPTSEYAPLGLLSVRATTR